MDLKIENRKNFIQCRKIPLQELETYYQLRRKEAYEKNLPISGIIWRKRLHFLLLLGLYISRKLSGMKLQIISDQRVNTNRPVIYACTHIGWSDAEMALEAIKSHAFLFVGSRRQLINYAMYFVL